MDQSNVMMSLLIPGPDSPGKDFDVFLEPLVEELHELWEGVKTYDVLAEDDFYLKAAVIWCIHDYPALSTLSGRTTRGYALVFTVTRTLFHTVLRAKWHTLGTIIFLTGNVL